MLLNVRDSIDFFFDKLCGTLAVTHAAIALELQLLLPYRLINQLQLQLSVHLLEQGRLRMDHLRMPLAERGLINLLRQEASRLPELHDLLVVQLHESLVFLRETIARHLTEPETGCCGRVR